MGIKIHHGPDGTFKTSGAIKDDIIPVIKSGRTLVTNVRGFSRQNAIKVLGRKFVHKDFKVIFVDTELQEGRDKLARFFHWAPRGAFFVIDEVQRIFKPKWRDKDIQLLNYEGGSTAAAADDRPEDMDTAWDMQRHYSWDFVFTTTSITKVRAEMRDMAKIAVRHTNVGLWRFYKTVEHSCDSRGNTKSTQGTIKYFNYVPKKIFNLYSSTKTGTFTNTEPRTAFYKDPKILGLLLTLGMFWTYLLNKPVPQALGGDNTKTTNQAKPANQQTKTDSKQIDNQATGVSSQNSLVTSNDINNVDVSNVKPSQVGVLDTFLNDIYITGSVYSTAEKIYAFASNNLDVPMEFTSLDLHEYGYQVSYISSCKAKITKPNFVTYAYCSTNNFLVKQVIEQVAEQARSHGTAASE